MEQLLPALQQHFAGTPGAQQQEMMLRLMAQSHICDATGGQLLDNIAGHARHLIASSLVRNPPGHQDLRRGIEGFASPAGPSKGDLSHHMRALCVHRSWTYAAAMPSAQLRAKRVDLCFLWVRHPCCLMRSLEDMPFSLRAWNTEAGCSVAALVHKCAPRLEGIASPATRLFEEPASAEARYSEPHACPNLCCLFPRPRDAWMTVLTRVPSTVISPVAQNQCAVVDCIGTGSCCAHDHRSSAVWLLASSSAAFNTETSCMLVVCQPGALRRRACCFECYHFVISYCISLTMQIGAHTCRAELLHVSYAAVAGRLTQPKHHAGLVHGCRLFRFSALWHSTSEGKWSLRFGHPFCGRLVRVLKIAPNTRDDSRLQVFTRPDWLSGRRAAQAPSWMITETATTISHVRSLKRWLEGSTSPVKIGAAPQCIHAPCVMRKADWASGHDSDSTGLAIVSKGDAHKQAALLRSLEGSSSRSHVQRCGSPACNALLCVDCHRNLELPPNTCRSGLYDHPEQMLFASVSLSASIADAQKSFCRSQRCHTLHPTVSWPWRSCACRQYLRKTKAANAQKHLHRQMGPAHHTASPLTPRPPASTWTHVSAMGKKSKATWRRQGTRPGKWQRNNPVAPEKDEAVNADIGAAATPGPVGLPLEVRAQPVEAAIDEEDDLAPEAHEASISSCIDQLHALPEPPLSDGVSEPASSSTGAPIASQAQEQPETVTSSPELLPASPTPPTPPRPRRGTRAEDDAMELLPDERVNRIGGELRRVSYPPLIEQRDGETRLAYLRRAIEESLAFKRRQESQQRDLSAGKSSQSPTAAFVLSSIIARERAHLMCLAWCMFAVIPLLRSGVVQQTTSSSNAGPCASESVCTADTPRKIQPLSRHSKHSRPHTTKRADPGPKSWSRGYISTRLGRLIVFASPTLSQGFSYMHSHSHLLAAPAKCTSALSHKVCRGRREWSGGMLEHACASEASALVFKASAICTATRTF